ncbi:MAG: hypothetical protein KAS04_04535 [Candidatus Aenigmarchaeota archaeon]|nr:hypothetical protein [Candidatus Aenigmarchaeota archaeon]
MAKSIIPPDMWDPSCPRCGEDLDIDDGNGKLECRSCNWSEKHSKKSVCGKCNSEIDLSTAYKYDGFCIDCHKEIRRKLE